MKKIKQFRQGDVWIEKIQKLPKDVKAKARDKGRVILAYGEVTGHAHAIADPDVDLFEIGDTLYMDVPHPVELKHEEHGTIEIPTGTYKSYIQREYDVEEERQRRVLD